MTLATPISPASSTPAPAAVDLQSIRLPALPQAVMALLEMLRRGNANVDLIAREVERDPAMATRVVGMANSPMFTRSRRLASIQDAIRFLGTATLRTLVVGAGLRAAFVQVPGVDMDTFWSDAATTAQGARGLARLVGADAEEAYLAGLLHSAGHLVLCHGLPSRAAGLRPTRPPIRGAALANLERMRFGLDHTIVGARWLEQMGMASGVVQAIAHYLDGDARTMPQLARIVCAASHLAESLDLAEDDEAALARLGALAWWPGGIGLEDTSGVVDLLEQLRQAGVDD